jgi:hypothetical protein
MVTFSAYHTTTLYEACQTVLELIDEISNIPIEYLRAMGLAMVSFDTPKPHIYTLCFDSWL